MQRLQRESVRLIRHEIQEIFVHGLSALTFEWLTKDIRLSCPVNSIYSKRRKLENNCCYRQCIDNDIAVFIKVYFFRLYF